MTSIREEKAQARVTPKQATPFFFDKLKRLCLYLWDRQISPTQRYLFARDLAFFCLDFLPVIEPHIFTVKIATGLACAQRRYPCNNSGFRRQCCSSLQGTHLPIYANFLWFSVSLAKLRRSGPVKFFFPLPSPLRRRVHLSLISVLRPSASAKSCFPQLSIAKVVSGCFDSENGLRFGVMQKNLYGPFMMFSVPRKQIPNAKPECKTHAISEENCQNLCPF